jgi:3-phenylpropionate/cinnamic acid dioxygenase small subunit
MIAAVMLDMDQKETYVEVFTNDIDYKTVLNNNEDTRHPTSIFESAKDAIREAKRVSKMSSGWKYNSSRYKEI